MARLKRKRDKVRETAYGRHSPAGSRYLESLKARGLKLKRGKVKKTLATKGVERRLRAAGLTEKEIASLR